MPPGDPRSGAAPASIPSAHITGLLLAGGQGSRMGGADKGLLELQGESLAAHALRRLRPQVGELLISANRNLDEYARLGARVLPDAQPGDFAGPLAGMAAGLRACTTPWLLSVPCDGPWLPPDLAQRLGEAALAAGRDAAIAVAGGRRQPVHALLRSDLLESLLEFLRGDGRKVEDWLRTVGFAEAVFEDPRAFDNINLPQQLEALRAPD